jgi:hypothetical protein
MPNVVKEAFACFRSAQTETFGNQGVSTFIPLMAALVTLLILLFVGQYLWNNALCPLVSVVRPAKSIFQVLGVALLFGMLFP